MKEINKKFTSAYPSKEECFQLMDEYGTPEHVKRHCHAVSEVGKAIAMALNASGLTLNIPLVISAGFLHDIARVHSKHERVGGDYLISIGLDEVGKTIQNHTFHKIVHTGYDINEEDVLCIADRVVLEDKFVGPEKRMAYIANKAVKKFGEEKRNEINKWAEYFVAYIKELEEFIGKKLVDIVPEGIKA